MQTAKKRKKGWNYILCESIALKKQESQGEALADYLGNQGRDGKLGGRKSQKDGSGKKDDRDTRR